MSKDDFFIGWKGQVSVKNKYSISKLLIPAFIFIPIFTFLIVFFTKPFSNGIFEFGNVKEFTGVYHEMPFPVLVLDQNQLEPNMNTNALLVGYGKIGAKSFMKVIEEEKGGLSGKRIKIQGTLIYGDNRTLIELTEEEDSVIEVFDNSPSSVSASQKKVSSFQGEILDPKCWFGVMKPAEGKVHKSCAIRCISGGIPPVLRVKNNDSNTYYLLKGEAGQDINQEVLAYIAEPVEIGGKSYFENGWNILNINPSNIKILE